MADPGSDENGKYDHSDHPTTHARPDDIHPPSDAKKDDAADERGNSHHPANGIRPAPLEKPAR